MSGSEHERGKAVSVRLLEALNAHDLEGQLGLFKEDYRSEQPVHPARTFSGREQVRENWSKLYESIPDFQANSSATPSLGRRSGVNGSGAGPRRMGRL